MPDLSKWGLGPDDVSGAQPTQSVSEPDFNTKWGLNEAPVETKSETKTSAKKPLTLENFINAAGIYGKGVVKTIGQALATPGDVFQSTPDNPVTTESLIGPAGTLASLVGMRPLPSTYGLPKPLIDPEVGRLAALARDKFDIPIRGGQISPSPSIRWLDAAMESQPLTGLAKSNAAQHAGFDKALATMIGSDADRVTLPVIKQFKKDYGQAIDDVADQVGVLTPDVELHRGLSQVYKDAVRDIPDKADAIKNKIGDLVDAIKENGGALPAETYKGLMRKNGPFDPGKHKSDGSVANSVEELRGVMKDFLARNAPEDQVANLNMWNKRYAVMKTIEPLVKKSTTGSVSPPTLMNKVQGWSGDLHDLGAIGQMIKPMASSGTSERTNILQKLKVPAALGGAEGAALWYDPVLATKLAIGAAIGGGLKLGANATIGGLLRREGYADRLINSTVPGREGGLSNLLQKLTNRNAPYLPPAAVTPALPVYAQP